MTSGVASRRVREYAELIVNGTRHDGAFDFESLVAAIDAEFLRP